MLAIVAWVVLLVLGRYPQTLYDWNAGAYLFLLTDIYPPVGLDAPKLAAATA